MENESKPMYATECLIALNAGGWMVTGGREVGLSDITMRIPMLEASVVGDKIRVVTTRGLYEALAENIISSDNGQRIMILGVYTKKEQKKQVDGGGWRDVEYTASALKFQTVASLYAADKAREERRKHAEEVLKKWHEEQRRKEKEEAQLLEEARKARQEEFARELSDKFVGKKLARIDLKSSKAELLLEFDDGTQLVINSQDYEDYCSWLVVNGESLR